MKTATICFLVKNGEVCLSEKKQGFGRGYLNGYGGKVNDGETIENAAVREIQEEAGVIVNPANLEKVAVIEFFEEEKPLFECHVFFVLQWTGEFGETEEMGPLQCFPLERVPYERMWKADREWVPLVFSGKKIRAKAHYKKGMTEIKHFVYEDL